MARPPTLNRGPVRTPSSVALSTCGGSSRSARSGGGSPIANHNATSLARGPPNHKPQLFLYHLSKVGVGAISPNICESVNAVMDEFSVVMARPEPSFGHGTRALSGIPSDGGSIGLAHLKAARAGNPTEPLQPLALSKQSAIKALKSVSVTRPIWAVPAP